MELPTTIDLTVGTYTSRAFQRTKNQVNRITEHKDMVFTRLSNCGFSVALCIYEHQLEGHFCATTQVPKILLHVIKSPPHHCHINWSWSKCPIACPNVRFDPTWLRLRHMAIHINYLLRSPFRALKITFLHFTFSDSVDSTQTQLTQLILKWLNSRLKWLNSRLKWLNSNSADSTQTQLTQLRTQRESMSQTRLKGGRETGNVKPSKQRSPWLFLGKVRHGVI